MTSRILSYVFFLIALILFGVAGYGYYLHTDGPGAAFEEAERAFPGLAVGENIATFRLHNPTRHAVRVVGCSFCWGSNCRFGLKRAIPFEIPAGATEELECVLEVARPGAFATQIHLFLDDRGLREQFVAIHGTAGP